MRPAPQRGRSLRVVASPLCQRQAQQRLSLVLCAHAQRAASRWPKARWRPFALFSSASRGRARRRPP
eukprot:4201526-Pyramimonas_sp.AAC.1